MLQLLKRDVNDSVTAAEEVSPTPPLIENGPSVSMPLFIPAGTGGANEKVSVIDDDSDAEDAVKSEVNEREGMEEKRFRVDWPKRGGTLTSWGETESKGDIPYPKSCLVSCANIDDDDRSREEAGNKLEDSNR